MSSSHNGCALRIYVSGGEVVDGKPLCEAIVDKARDLGIATAVVVPASLGFVPAAASQSSGSLRLGADLPVLIELVDTRERLEEILPYLDKRVGGGVSTLVSVDMRRYPDSPAT